MTRFPRVGRRLTPYLALAATALLSACITAGARQEEAIRLAGQEQIRSTLDSLKVEQFSNELSALGRDGGPRVSVWTNVQYESVDRVTPSFKLDDDAYVAVFNVDRDGRVRVLYPETPQDHGFLRGGKTYRLPAFFPGFARTGLAAFTRAPEFGLASSRFGSLTGYGSPSYGYSQLDRYAGYVFIVASWAPMRLETLEELDRWDAYLTGQSESDFEPYNLTRSYAELLVPRGKRWYTIAHRFYGEQMGGRAFASQCSYQEMTGSSYMRGVLNAFMSGQVNRTELANLYNALALSGCDDGMTMMYRALILRALAAGGGFQVPTVPTSPPPTQGDEPNLGTGGGSLPAPPEHPRPGNGHRKADGDDGAADPRATRPPKRGDTETDDTIDLGTRAPRPGQRRPADTRASWDAPRATRGESVRASRPREVSNDDAVRLPAPRDRSNAEWRRPSSADGRGYGRASDAWSGGSRNAEARRSGSSSSASSGSAASSPRATEPASTSTTRTESPRTESPRSESGKPTERTP